MAQKKRPNIVSVHLSPQAKTDLDRCCAERGMTIKSLLGRLITWFVVRDKTEQSIVLGQVDDADVSDIAQLLLRRGSKGSSGGARGKRGRSR